VVLIAADDVAESFPEMDITEALLNLNDVDGITVIWDDSITIETTDGELYLYAAATAEHFDAMKGRPRRRKDTTPTNTHNDNIVDALYR
jgi:hypothetical protein